MVYKPQSQKLITACGKFGVSTYIIRQVLSVKGPATLKQTRQISRLYDQKKEQHYKHIHHRTSTPWLQRSQHKKQETLFSLENNVYQFQLFHKLYRIRPWLDWRSKLPLNLILLQRASPPGKTWKSKIQQYHH